MSHCLPSVVAGSPLAGSIIGIWDKDSIDPGSLNYNAIWTSLCSCDYITGTSSIGCVGGTSGIGGTVIASVSGGVEGCTGITSIVYGSCVVSSIVGGTGVTSIVESSSGVSVPGGVVGGSGVSGVSSGTSGTSGTSGVGVSGSVVSGIE